MSHESVYAPHSFFLSWRTISLMKQCVDHPCFPAGVHEWGFRIQNPLIPWAQPPRIYSIQLPREPAKNQYIKTFELKLLLSRQAPQCISSQSHLHLLFVEMFFATMFFFWSSVFSVFLRTWISTQTLDGRRQWHPLRHCEAGVKVPSGLKEIGSGSERCAPHLKVVNIKYIILRAIKLVKRKAAHRTFYFVALFSNIGIILVWKSLPLWNFAQNVGMFWGHVSLRSFRISSWNHF